jgi:hypothetical protein
MKNLKKRAAKEVAFFQESLVYLTQLSAQIRSGKVTSPSCRKAAEMATLEQSCIARL